MKVYEISSLAPEFLKRLHDFGIKLEDYQWLDLYREYREMRLRGEKTVYIVAHLSDQYCICERKVYKLIRLMERDCPTGAAG